VKNCPICETSSADFLFNAKDFDNGIATFKILRCRECGLARTDPQVPDNILSTYYANLYYGNRENKFHPWLEYLTRTGNRNRAKYLLHFLNDSTEKNFRVLDIGCGRGALLHELAKRNCDCHGLERHDFLIPVHHHGISYHLGNITDQALPANSFDLVVIWHALEHLPDPKKTLQQAVGLMKAGAVLALATPNFASRQAGWFGPYWFHLDLPRHFWHFTPEDLISICSELKLELLQQSDRSPGQNIFGFLQSTLNRAFPGKPNRLYKLMHSSAQQQKWKLFLWLLVAGFVFPLAFFEYLMTSKTNKGATIIQYWKKC
jgi:SAM-dependent methyltransferase